MWDFIQKEIKTLFAANYFKYKFNYQNEKSKARQVL